MFLFLGTGADTGTPNMHCSCPECKKARKKGIMTRTSSSALYKRTLIDCGPYVNYQFARENLTSDKVDAVIITHPHSDHLHGLGSFSDFEGKLPVYGSKETIKQAKWVFDYMDNIRWKVVKRSAKINKVKYDFLPISHCDGSVGLRFNDTFYVSDCGAIDDRLFSKIKNLKTIIFDGTFYDVWYPSHLPRVISREILEDTNARRIIYTHINHGEILEKLPRRFLFAKDGMKIRL
jgi:phosphoribosyl 1,2-cyclic phosphate phosphodiesterase